MIQNIQSHPIQQRYYSRQPANKQTACNADKQVQTSIYNTKGLNIAFGSLAKGQNYIEEECIHLLRKVREGRCRKFAEDDISEIISDLRKNKNTSEQPNVLQEVLTVENSENGQKPDKHFIKKLVKLVADNPEDERFAILEFAENELKTSTSPLSEFSNIPPENKKKLAVILKEISNINEPELFKSENARNEILDSLYDRFKVAVYAHEDLKTLPTAQKDAYRIEKINLLKDDMKFFQNSNNYANNTSKTKTESVARQIYDYFLDNLI